MASTGPPTVRIIGPFPHRRFPGRWGVVYSHGAMVDNFDYPTEQDAAEGRARLEETGDFRAERRRIEVRQR